MNHGLLERIQLFSLCSVQCLRLFQPFQRKSKGWREYYEEKSILDEITDEPIDLSLGDTLREEILSGRRKRKLKNVTIKVDPLQIMAIKKLSNMKSIPYQTLIRHWLSEGIKEELDSVLK